MTWQLDATSLSALLDARDITPLQLLEQSLARLDALEPVLNAFTHVDRDGALAAARAATARQAAGTRLSPLDGIPVSVKDNIFVGRNARPMGQPAVPRSCARPRRYLRGTAARCRRRHHRQDHHAGIRLLGRTHSRLSGVTRNPWDPSLTPGGSSGGAVASVAAGSHRSRSAPTWAAAHASRLPIPASWGCGLRPGGCLAGSAFRPRRIDFQASARSPAPCVTCGCCTACSPVRTRATRTPSGFRPHRMSRPTARSGSAGSPRSAMKARRRRSRRASPPPSTAWRAPIVRLRRCPRRSISAALRAIHATLIAAAAARIVARFPDRWREETCDNVRAAG